MQLMKIVCSRKQENGLPIHIWYPRTTLLSAPCVNCVYSYCSVYSCLSFLHHSVAHWNCIIFPGGERNCGVHELICVRKGTAGQCSGRLTSDLWPDTLISDLIKLESFPPVCLVLLYRFHIVPLSASLTLFVVCVQPSVLCCSTMNW